MNATNHANNIEDLPTLTGSHVVTGSSLLRWTYSYLTRTGGPWNTRVGVADAGMQYWAVFRCAPNGASYDLRGGITILTFKFVCSSIIASRPLPSISSIAADAGS